MDQKHNYQAIVYYLNGKYYLSYVSIKGGSRHVLTLDADELDNARWEAARLLGVEIIEITSMPSCNFLP
jgi:hypothetical protein